MKRKQLRVLSVLLICVLLLSACGKKDAAKSDSPAGSTAAQVTPSPAYDMTALSGLYVEPIAQRGQLLLTAQDPVNTSIVIDWPNSAAQVEHWEMTGVYDAVTNTIVYKDGVHSTRTFDEQGNETSAEVARDLTGSFSITDTGLRWVDDQSENGEPADFNYEMSMEEYEAAQSQPAPSTPAPAQTETPAAAEKPAATAAPAATEAPATTAAPAAPAETPIPGSPRIMKHPTAETVKEGGSCYFVAKYDNAIWAVWHFVSPDGTEDLTYEEAAERFPTMEIVDGMYSTMLLKKIPAELNGWSVYCDYSNRVGHSRTNAATVTVTAA